MTAPLLSLAAVALCWPAWIASGWVAGMLAPEGVALLMRGGLMILLLGTIGRMLDHIGARADPQGESDGHE